MADNAGNIDFVEETQKDLLQTYQENLQPDVLSLKNIANRLINNTLDIQQHIFKTTADKQLDLVNKKSALFQDKKINSVQMAELKRRARKWLNADRIAKLMDEVFLFQEQINAILGQQIKTIFVYRSADGKPTLVELEHNSSNQYAAQFQMKYGKKFDIRYRTPSSLEKYKNNIEEKDKNEFNFNEQGLLSAYNETWERGLYSRKINYGGNKNDRTSMLIMWKPAEVWKKMLISSGGYINEAYANFYLQNKSSPNFMSSNLEILVNDFLEQGVAKTDTESGLLKGDVEIDNIEYAIKGSAASPLSLIQVFNLAYAIAETPETELTKDFLENIKNSLAQNKIQPNREFNKALDKDIEQLLKAHAGDISRQSIQIQKILNW